MKTVYKILAPLCSIAVLPALFFLPLLHLDLGETLNGSLGLRPYSSLFQLIKMAGSTNDQTKTILNLVLQILQDEDNKIGAALNTKGYFVASLVFLALLVVFALLVFFFAVFSKKYLLTAGFAAGGLLSAVLANKMFDVFARPFLSGAVSLKSLMSEENLISAFLGNLIKVESLELAMAYQVCLFLMAGALILAVCAAVERSMAES